MKRFFYIFAAISLFSCTALEEEWRYDDPGYEEPEHEDFNEKPSTKGDPI